ncbi:MAG: porin family protein [candidate division Zixibacteria bacterium]|nr:porin family protein [candidate division Zixibacteria bacterium]
MKRLATLILMLCLVALSANALAQDEEEFEEKDLLEAAIFIGPAIPMGGITDWKSTGLLGDTELGTDLGMNFGFDVGYFATANMVVGLGFTYSQFGVKSDSVEVENSKHRFYNAGLYLKYYFFGESSLVPYLKAQVGVDNLKFTTRVQEQNGNNIVYRELAYDPALSIAAGAGIFYYTHDYGGLYLEVDYHHGFTSDITGSYQGLEYDFGETAASVDVRAGVKVFFGND